MIYLNENTTIVNFPQTTQNVAKRITFTNQVTNSTFYMDVDVTGNGVMYSVNMSGVINRFKIGQYDYTITTTNNVYIGGGIIQFGEFMTDKTQYQIEQTIIQYDEKDTPSIIGEDYVYFGFGLNEENVIERGNQTKGKNADIRLFDISEDSGTYFYYIVNKNFNYCLPQEFTCGGAPMVMQRLENKEIRGCECIVYRSGAKYPIGTQLHVLVKNI